MRKLIVGLFSLLSTEMVQAQTIFSYGNQSVSKDEFLKMYVKNALNKKPDYSPVAVNEYINLYSLFRMKVTEAENQHLDTLSNLSQELDNYRKQLSKNYLTDKEVTNRLIEEAYNRSKTDLHVAHILVSCNSYSSPADSLKAFKKADSIYQLLQNQKNNFSQLAKALSDDKGSKESGGDIGYMTTLQTIYSFENAVYATPVGKISKPFRTQFGYHIVKIIDKRNSRGEVQVAQILITAKKTNDSASKIALGKANQALLEIKNGAHFEDVVKKYSEDKYTLDKKGVMAPFGTGKTVPEFENTAFSLKNIGDVSQPIQTDYGFHILKLIAKFPPKAFDSVKENLKRKIENDSRSQVVREIFMNKLKTEGGFKENNAALEAIKKGIAQIPDTGLQANLLNVSNFKNMNETLFNFAGTAYTQNDFINFTDKLTHGRISGTRSNFVNDIYKIYVERTVNDYEEHHLADVNPDFKNLMTEYKNGVMLFELMDRNVWGKASRDTTGLKNFYETHKANYNWEPGFNGAVYHFKDEATMNKGVKLLSQNTNLKDEEVYKALNSENSPEAVSIQRNRYEFKHFTEIPKSEIISGKISKTLRNTDGSYTVVKADKIFETPTTKSLDEARGFIVAEYQDFLEKEWNNKLRLKYPLKINEAVLKTIFK